MGLSWASLIGAICVSLVGQVLLKLGASGAGGIVGQLLRPATIAGLACYGGSALFYILALRRLPMSVALPCTAAGYVVVAMIGHFAFGETLGLQKGVALALIVGGVLILAAAP